MNNNKKFKKLTFGIPYNAFWSCWQQFFSLTPDQFSSPSHPNFVPSFFFLKIITRQLQSVLSIYSWLWGHPLEHGWLTSSYILIENWRSHFHKLFTTHSPWVGNADSWTPSHFMLDYWLTWKCADFVRSMSSWVWWPYHGLVEVWELW